MENRKMTNENKKTLTTKKDLFAELEKVKNQVIALDENADFNVSAYDEITENDKKDAIKKALSAARKDLKTLQSQVDTDIQKALEKDGKKAVFKWASINGFYKMKLQAVTPEKIKVGYKISFRLDTKTIKRIDNSFYYNDKNKSDFSAITFENGQDVGTVKKIDENGQITVKSDNYGGIWYLIADDFNGKNDTICTIKDGSKIAFLVYAPKEN